MFLTSSPKSTLGPALSSTNPFASNFERVTSFHYPGFWLSTDKNFTLGPRAENLRYGNQFLLTTSICWVVQNQPSDFLVSSDDRFEGFYGTRIGYFS